MAIEVGTESKGNSPDSPAPSSHADSKQSGSTVEEMEATDATDATNAQRTLWSWILQFFGLGSDFRTDDRYNGLKVKPITAYPDGYPQYAAFIDTDDNFRIYRRYGTLRNRVILQRQLELALLEKKLDELDEKDNNQPRRYRLASIKYDKEQGDSERIGLIEEIDKKLEQYDTLLARERESLAMEKPTKRNHLNLIHWVWNKKTIAKDEIELLNRIDDFVVLSRHQDSPFQTFLEDQFQRFPLSWIQRIFVSKVQQKKAEGTEDSGISLFSKTKIGALIRLVVTLITVALLMLPVCLLFKLNMADKAKVAFVLAFIPVFPIAISIVARPKPHEIFAATAAYIAVLVVFLAKFSGGGIEAIG